jgi:predicted metal-binding membrane protein
VGASWIPLLAASLGEPGPVVGHPAHAGVGALAVVRGSSALAPVLTGLAHWQLMVVAMMFPLLVPSVRVVAFRSFRRRRHRAIAFFLAGHLALWALAGLAVCGVLSFARGLNGDGLAVAAAGAFLVAALWQQTRWRRRALVACHWTMPLSPTGPRADRDAFVFGWRIGGSCCLTCCPLMLACTLTGHGIPALLACAAIGRLERTLWRPDPRLVGLAALGLALAYGASAVG